MAADPADPPPPGPGTSRRRPPARPERVDGASERVEARVSARLDRERWVLLEWVAGALEPVMVALSAAWIALLVAELVTGELPRALSVLVWGIWAAFGVDFLLRFVIAPRKGAFLRHNWLTALSLVLPAFRVLRLATGLRVLRAARVVRSVGLLRVVTSLNRGLGALGRTARRRGVGYVAAATALVMIVGAAAMTWFEASAGVEGGAPAGSEAFADFGSALWWTASTMTTGAPAEPRTAEGRIVGWLLSVYGLGIFGYITATLASHFVGQDVSAPGARER